MAVVANKRSIMTLYSNKLCPYSHRVRIVLAEKGVSVDILDVNLEDKPEDLIDLNPYNSVPTLVDRDLVLYESRIIMEYLDERFPHPPLLPVYPVARSKMRLLMYRIDRDWYSLMGKIKFGSDEEADNARKALAEGLTAVSRLFDEMPYFLSEDFTLVDCYLAPLLWRLDVLGVKLPPRASAIQGYLDRVFVRDGFMAILITAIMEIDRIRAVYAGTALGLVMTLAQLGGFASPPIGNSLADISPGIPFIFWASLAAIPIIGFYFLRQKSTQQPTA